MPTTYLCPLQICGGRAHGSRMRLSLTLNQVDVTNPEPMTRLMRFAFARRRTRAPELRLTTAERSTSLDAETKDFVCRSVSLPPTALLTNGRQPANFRERRNAVIESKREY